MKKPGEKPTSNLNYNLPRTKTTEMVSKARGGYHQDDASYAGAGREKKGRPKKIWLENIN